MRCEPRYVPQIRRVFALADSLFYQCTITAAHTLNDHFIYTKTAQKLEFKRFGYIMLGGPLKLQFFEICVVHHRILVSGIIIC